MMTHLTHSAVTVSAVYGAVSQQACLHKLPINPVAKWDGLVFGDYHLFVAQVLSILVTIAVAVVGTLICVGIVRLFTKLRVDENSENVGLDDSEHGERVFGNMGVKHRKMTKGRQNHYGFVCYFLFKNISCNVLSFSIK